MEIPSDGKAALLSLGTFFCMLDRLTYWLALGAIPVIRPPSSCGLLRALPGSRRCALGDPAPLPRTRKGKSLGRTCRTKSGANSPPHFSAFYPSRREWPLCIQDYCASHGNHPAHCPARRTAKGIKEHSQRPRSRPRHLPDGQLGTMLRPPSTVPRRGSELSSKRCATQIWMS